MSDLPSTSDHRRSVLIVSNGYGEDAVGGALTREIGGKVEVTAYPLVGLGHAFSGVPLLEPRRVLPSGGFGLRGSWKALLNDVQSGGLRFWREQRERLRQERGRRDLVVAIGDVFCLWMAARAGTPVTFVATAKSEYNEPYRILERYLIRRLATVTYTRDQPTAEALIHHGLQARCVGNPLMDTIGDGERLHLDATLPTLTLLPGSRTHALGNFALMLQLCAEVWRSRPANAICAIAPTIELAGVVEVAARSGWQSSGLTLKFPLGVLVLTYSFGAAIRASDVVVGLAGTANEQAAGLGRPVVAFPGPGSQYTRRFMTLQHRLLGDALVPAENWREAAAAVIRLLVRPEERARRGTAGRERMGDPGAIQKIAAEILS